MVRFLKFFLHLRIRKPRLKLVDALALMIILLAVLYFRFHTSIQPLGNTSSSPKIIKFAIMADIHVDLKNLEKALILAKKEGVEFVIILGDLTIMGKYNEFEGVKRVIESSNLEYYILPGNHDYFYRRDEKKIFFFGEVFGPDFKSFKKEGAKFILINNADQSKRVSDVWSKEGRRQDEWLKEELKECSKPYYCLVFTSSPLDPLHLNLEEGDATKSASITEAGELLNLFIKSGVKEVFSAGLHYYFRYDYGNLKNTLVGAITAAGNPYSPEFLIITIEGRSLTERQVIIPKDSRR